MTLIDDGPLPDRWLTKQGTTSVLAIVHNVTAATRMLDVLQIIAGDPRIEVVFTCPGSSAFTAGTDDYLSARGISLIAWKEAIAGHFDVAISASYGGDLHEIEAPLIIIPHGMGYNKFLETGNRKPETGNRKPETGNRKPVFGLSDSWIMHEGSVVPDVIALSHTEQLDRLRISCPEAAPAAKIIGDPCVDRLAASRPLRETYRQAFGLTAGQRLVVVTSTWGEHSLFGHWPELIGSLAQQLPLDTHRVALALHPNIPHGHSAWQVRRWLDNARREGVLVLPDGDLWMPALVAADLAIGDHGSVTFYAAGHGLPVLLASAPTDAVDPGSPIGGLLRVAPILKPDDDLPRRIDEVVAGHDPARYASLTSLATSRPGEFATLFRRTVLDLVNLPDPGHGPFNPPAPAPQIRFHEPSATLVRAELTPHPDALDIVVSRYPAGSLANPWSMPAETHLVLDVRDPDLTLLPMADVVVHEHAVDAERWTASTLRDLPGCQLAAAQDDRGWLLRTADGSYLRLDTPTGGRFFASAVRNWLHSGNELARLPYRLRLRLAGETITATVVATAPSGR